MSTEPTDAQIEAFRTAWLEADRKDEIGNRVRAGLRAALAADRPPVTDNARAEAERRYQGDWDQWNGEPVDDWGYSEAERRAFVAGAQWAAGRAETTTDTTEDAQREAVEAILDAHGESYDSDCGMYFGCDCGWDNDDIHSNEGYVEHVAHALAAAGLLARPTPTREDLMRAAGLYGKQADAVIDLLQGGTP